jgi:DNA-binding NarL/FixJ family response regulator
MEHGLAQIETEAEALKAVQKDVWQFKKLPSALRTQEVCRAALEADGNLLSYVPEPLKTKEMCRFAVEQTIYALRYVPHAVIDDDYFIKALRRNPSIFAKLNLQSKTQKICLAAVQGDAKNFIYVPEQTPELCLEAVSRDGNMLRYVKKQTLQLCLTAAKNNSHAVMYAKRKDAEIRKIRLLAGNIVPCFIHGEYEIINQVISMSENETAIIDSELWTVEDAGGRKKITALLKNKFKNIDGEMISIFVEVHSKKYYWDCWPGIEKDYIMDWELSKEKIERVLSFNYYCTESGKEAPYYYKHFKFSHVMFSNNNTKALLYLETRRPGGSGKGEFLLFENITISDKEENFDLNYILTESLTVWESQPKKINAMTERKKNQLIKKNGTIDLSTAVIGDASLTQNLICRFLTDRSFDIIGVSSLQGGSNLLKNSETPHMLVIMVDRGNEALTLIEDIEIIYRNKGFSLPNILLWSEYDNYIHVTSALNYKDGKKTLDKTIRSFIGREETAEELVTAIWNTAEGRGYLAPRLAKKVRELSRIVSGQLTKNEGQTFTYVQLGYTNEEIASRLDIKKHSVENTLKTICEKMRVKNREELYWL